MVLEGRGIVYKVVSISTSLPILEDKSISDLLLDASELISKLGTTAIPVSEEAKAVLKEVRALVGKAILKSDESPQSRSSSITSTASLGDRIAIHDKEKYLYTYKWVMRSARSGTDPQKAPIWNQGNDFRSWVESTKPFPRPGSAINCWEAIAILLVRLTDVTKQDIKKAYDEHVTGTSDQGAVSALFGLGAGQKTNMQDLVGNLKTGDVLFFHPQGKQSITHVVLVLDNEETLWVASH